MTDKTIVALYDDPEDARRAMESLTAAGISAGDMSVKVGDPAAVPLPTPSAFPGPAGGESWISGTGEGFNAQTGAGAAAASAPWANDFGMPGGRVEALVGLGVSEPDAHVYAEGIRRGGTLLIVRASSDEADRVLDIIERHAPADIDERARFWREEGWTRYDAEARDYDAQAASAERARYAQGVSAAARAMRGADAGPAYPARAKRFDGKRSGE